MFLFPASQIGRCIQVLFSVGILTILFNLQIKELYSFSDRYLVKTVKALDDSFNSAVIFSHDHGINQHLFTLQLVV